MAMARPTSSEGSGGAGFLVGFVRGIGLYTGPGAGTGTDSGAIGLSDS